MKKPAAMEASGRKTLPGHHLQREAVDDCKRNDVVAFVEGSEAERIPQHSTARTARSKSSIDWRPAARASQRLRKLTMQ